MEITKCVFKLRKRQFIIGKLEGELSDGTLAVRSKKTRKLYFCKKEEVYIDVRTLEENDRKMLFPEW